MSSRISDFEHRFSTLSPALKFGVIGIVFIVLFLVWDMTIAPTTQRWAEQANALEAKVQHVHRSSKIAASLQQLRPQITTLGAVELPSGSQATYTELNALVNSLLEKYGGQIEGEEFSLIEARVGGKVSNAVSWVGTTQELNRLASTLTFVGPPDVAAEIVRALEESPHVEALTEVRMRREDDRRVNVQIKLEAWVVSDKKSRV